MESMFKTLMQMPLFHGVSYEKLSDIVGKHRFHFLKAAPGQIIINAGDPCTHLVTVVSGSVRTSIVSADGRVKVSQTLTAPATLYPDFFFGRTTNFPASVTSLDQAGIMQIEKRDYINIINSDSVFLFNFLNTISVDAQLATDGVMALTSGDLSRRIAYWIAALTQRGGTEIVMECRQRDLYSVFGVPRQSLVAALTEMRQSGVLDFSANRIEIHDRRKLISLLDEKQA